jgi:hypothetical protein
MDGAFSITGYQVKLQQKEEQLALRKVSAVLCKVIQKQVSISKSLIGQEIKNSQTHFQAKAKELLPA